jgi:hypothetical protein
MQLLYFQSLPLIIKPKIFEMKKVLFGVTWFTMIIYCFSSCQKDHHQGPSASKYPADVAIEWMRLQMRLTRVTPGFNSVVASRSFGYSGITLYESIVPGIHQHQSVALQLSGITSLPPSKKATYYWPASANAAMASITRALFGNASAGSLASIDSLEAAFTAKFQSKATAQTLQSSVEFGRLVATAIFEWSKTDGGHEGYAHVTSPDYIPPATPGSWVPTPPAFSQPIHPFWGNNRPFVRNVVSISQPGAPLPFSTSPKSPFYQMVNELYTISQNLTAADSLTARFWGDLPVNLNVPAHATNILTQLVVLNKYSLDDAAVAYAKHGIALSDAIISVFKTKYKYNLIRPVSYIRNVMGLANWNTVIPTPPHPEYTAAHAVVSSASATVLGDIFGRQYAFTDHSYDDLYGPRSFKSFDEYAKQAGLARLLAGIHYRPSIETGLKQGRIVGEMVNKLRFRGW